MSLRKKSHGKRAASKSKSSTQWQTDCASNPLNFLRIKEVWKKIVDDAKAENINCLKLKKDVTIAVLDTGVFGKHEAFKLIENSRSESQIPTSSGDGYLRENSRSESQALTSSGDAQGPEKIGQEKRRQRHWTGQTKNAVGSRILDSKNFVPESEALESDDENSSDLNEDTNGHGTSCAALCVGGTFRPVIENESVIHMHPLRNAPFANAEKHIHFKADFHCGVAPFAKLLNGKVVTSDGENEKCHPDWLADGIEWAIQNKADIISVSIGMNQLTPKLQDAIDRAVVEGVIIVCSASNDGRKEQNSVQYPARLGNVLCIGSHDNNGEHSKFSSRGREVDFLGPGEDIWSAASGGHEAAVVERSGTSFSTPYIAGLCALVLAYTEIAGGEDLREKVSNIVVMRRLLREMAASPNHHDESRGYGCLNPMKVFKFGKKKIVQLVDKMVQEPDPKENPNVEEPRMFRILREFSVSEFPRRKESINHKEKKIAEMWKNSQDDALKESGFDKVKAKLENRQTHNAQAAPADCGKESQDMKEEICLDMSYLPKFETPELTKKFLKLFLLGELKTTEIKTMIMPSTTDACQDRYLHIYDMILKTLNVKEFIFRGSDLVFALFKPDVIQPRKRGSAEKKQSYSQYKFSLHLDCSQEDYQRVKDKFQCCTVTKHTEHCRNCENDGVRKISVRNFLELMENSLKMAQFCPLDELYIQVHDALNFLKMYRYPFGEKMTKLDFFHQKPPAALHQKPPTELDPKPPALLHQKPPTELDPKPPAVLMKVLDKEYEVQESDLKLFQHVAIENKIYESFQEIHERCSAIAHDSEHYVEEVIMPSLVDLKNPEKLLTSPLVQCATKLVFKDCLSLTDVACIATLLQNGKHSLTFERILASFDPSLRWERALPQVVRLLEETPKALKQSDPAGSGDMKCLPKLDIPRVLHAPGCHKCHLPKELSVKMVLKLLHQTSDWPRIKQHLTADTRKPHCNHCKSVAIELEDFLKEMKQFQLEDISKEMAPHPKGNIPNFISEGPHESNMTQSEKVPNCLGRYCPCIALEAAGSEGSQKHLKNILREMTESKVTVAVFGDGIRFGFKHIVLPKLDEEIGYTSDGSLSRQHSGHFYTNFVPSEDCLKFGKLNTSTAAEDIFSVLSTLASMPRVLSMKVVDSRGHVDPQSLFEALNFLSEKEKTAQFEAGKEASEWPQADVLVFPFGLKCYSKEIMKKLISLKRRGKVILAAAWKTQGGISFPGCMGDIITMGFSCGGFQHEGREVDFIADSLPWLGSSQKGWAVQHSVGKMLGHVTYHIVNIIQHAEELGRQNPSRQIPDCRKKVTNNAVMREILHRMCSDPGHHTQDKGYGQLDPQPTFNEGTENFREMLSDILSSLAPSDEDEIPSDLDELTGEQV